MHRSKATVTEEEAAELMELWRSASTTPVMLIGGINTAASARQRFIRRIDELATSYGLAPQKGEWGFDRETRQFLSQYPIEEEADVEVPQPDSEV